MKAGSKDDQKSDHKRHPLEDEYQGTGDGYDSQPTALPTQLSKEG